MFIDLISISDLVCTIAEDDNQRFLFPGKFLLVGNQEKSPV
jgi:hypothetical protein